MVVTTKIKYIYDIEIKHIKKKKYGTILEYKTENRVRTGLKVHDPFL
jgi:hypothetical protein